MISVDFCSTSLIFLNITSLVKNIFENKKAIDFLSVSKIVYWTLFLIALICFSIRFSIVFICFLKAFLKGE